MDFVKSRSENAVAARSIRRSSPKLLCVTSVPLAAGAQLGDFLASHLLGAPVVRLDHPVQRHLAGRENDPMARPYIGWQGTRVPIQFPAAQFNPGFLLHYGHYGFRSYFMRHADHDAVGYLARQRADMCFHIAREYLVAERLDHPLFPPGQMQARGVLEPEIAGI